MSMIVAKRLKRALKSSAGRNVRGKITVYHRGGGHKRRYRLVEFGKNFRSFAGFQVIRFEYDPNRNVRVMLVKAFAARIVDGKVPEEGVFVYMVGLETLKAGMLVNQYAAFTQANVGRYSVLGQVPIGLRVSSLELYPGAGGIYARTAGANVQVLGSAGRYTTVKLPSGELRLVLSACHAFVGMVADGENKFIKLKKAGDSRHRGRRPVVRGVAMNPIDHPHGGGQGKTSGGRCSVSPWGVLTKGKKTVYVKSRFVVKGRKVKK